MSKRSQKQERDDLAEMVHQFSDAMLSKLLTQQSRGYAGWDDPKFRDNIVGLLIAHVRRAALDGEQEQWADIANLAAMLWRFDNDVD